MLRVGGVGSREFKKLELVSRLLETLPKNKVILVSGGARGVDHAFAGGGKGMGRWKGFATDIFPPEVERGCSAADYRKAAFARNKTIAAQSQVVVAFWDYESGGTANTIAHATVLGKPVYVVGPHGEGFDEAVAGVLRLLDTSTKSDTAEDDAKIGRLLRVMPCGHRIHRLITYNKGKEYKEFTVYDRVGVVAFSEDPLVALLSAFGKYSKEIYGNSVHASRDAQ